MTTEAQTSRRNWLVGSVAVAAAAVGLGVAGWRHGLAPRAKDEAMDAAFWQQSFDRPDGGQLSFAALKGKPLLLNFWATWCPPCVEEMPMLDAFFKEHMANGWQVVGLAIDQPSSVRKFLGKTPVSYPIGLAGMQGTELVKQLGNSAGGLPFTLVLGADGGVAARKMGKLETSDLDGWRRG